MSLRHFAAVAAIVSASLVAHADTVDTFNVTGDGTDPSLGQLSGTLSIDVTSGLITALDFDAEGITFTTFDQSSAFSFAGEYIIGVDDDNATLVLDSASLVAYGGSLLYLVGPNDSYAGSASPAIAATPEPSSIALLCTGMLGLSGVIKRRLA